MKVVLDMVLFIFFLASAAEVGFRWDIDALAWVRPGLPLLGNLMPGVTRLLLISVGGRVFVVDPCWIFMALCSSLINSSHVRERNKALLRSILVGGVWNGFLLGRVRGQVVPCRFCGAPDGDGHLFWECTFFLLLRSVKILSFTIS